jgi:hypothetical protein
MEDNPGKVVNGPKNWGAGFMPAIYQGTPLEAGDVPIKYLATPKDVSDDRQRKKLALLAELNRQHVATRPEQSELEARIASYELAFKMQAEAPEAVDLSQETVETRAMYGLDQKETASFGRMCLLARRLVERGVRFVQLYHRGWDNHNGLPVNIPLQARDVDQPQAALILDLKQRGLLEDTLVLWGGEFGRTNYCQGEMTPDNYGRDHHPRCFSIWMAGGGIKPGMVYGETDDFGYNIISNPVHVHDFQATVLNRLGLDHERLTYRYQGRRFRLTDVEGKVVRDILT